MLVTNYRKHFEISRAFLGAKPLDMHAEFKRSGSIQVADNHLILPEGTIPGDDGQKTKLEVETYLPFAAKPYHISPDIRDYVIVPVVTMPADLPNRNEVAFPLKSLVQFQPEYGVPAYLTFRGKPVQYEHDNQDITKAYGIILDSYLRKFKSENGGSTIWKMVKLLAIDRSKHADVAASVLSGEMNSYSMGAYVGHYSCSYCGGIVGKSCTHLSSKHGDKFYEKDGKLVFMNCCDVVGFEVSCVKNPAYLTAISDTLMSY